MLADFTLSPKDFDIDESKKLGSGSYGDVFQGTDKRTAPPVPVAVKVPKVEVTYEGWRSCLRELSVLARMKHAGALHLVGFHIPATGNCGPTILTPLMPGGTVADLLAKERKGMPDPRWDATKKSMCVFGVAVVMAYVHSKGILHRDLKIANVFVNEQFEPVIGDFGLARMCSLDMTMNCGTPIYMAPEMWVDEYDDKYTGAVDVYSYAVFLFQMFSDSLTLDDSPRPARSPAQWQMRVGQGARLKRPDNVIPDFYWELITNCWNHNPDMRPKFFEILDVLQKNRASYAFPGTDLGALEEYERRILEGVELVDRTGIVETAPPPAPKPEPITIEIRFDDCSDDSEHDTPKAPKTPCPDIP